MKVRVLGCSGAIAKDCRTTSFLLDDDILIDAGTGVGDLSLDEMRGIDHVFLTHSHLDHVAALPLMIDAVAAQRQQPLQVHGLASTLEALQTHIFNDLIWPDFTAIPTAQRPFLRFSAIEQGQTLVVKGRHIEALPAVHTVPAVGYAVRTDGPCWVFSGDTGRNPAFWQRVNALPVALLVIETAFSNREAELAQRSLHLSPHALAEDLQHIAPGGRYPIYITHTKPAETELVMSEIQNLKLTHDIRWLRAGQVFEF